MEKSSNSPPLRAAGYRRVSMKTRSTDSAWMRRKVTSPAYVESHGWELVDIYN